jgi:hypothetical protein
MRERSGFLLFTSSLFTFYDRRMSLAVPAGGNRTAIDFVKIPEKRISFVPAAEQLDLSAALFYNGFKITV